MDLIVYPEKTGIAGYQQSFDTGTNILAIVPGGELADEYVVIGAHYDHIRDCDDSTPDDTICNGASDNAAGVSAVPMAARVVQSYVSKETDGRVNPLMAAMGPNVAGVIGSAVAAGVLLALLG